jgi:hypothetical protein
MKFFLIQKHRQQFARATRSTMREAVGEFKWSAPHHPIIPTETTRSGGIFGGREVEG